jgi:2-oxoglutarate dehydrogenase E2 component (dihydrolipoamide succinyltransferase)
VDEALLEVSTDKVDTEIPSPVAGTLISIDVAVDSTVPVGARLAVIGGSGAVVATPAAPTPPPVAAPVVVAPVAPVAPVVTPPTPPVVAAPVAPVAQPQDSYVTPIVRKLASELGVNLASVRGTGIGGRIRREDVEAAAKPAAAPVASATPSAPRTSSPVATSPPK